MTDAPLGVLHASRAGMAVLLLFIFCVNSGSCVAGQDGERGKVVIDASGASESVDIETIEETEEVVAHGEDYFRRRLAGLDKNPPGIAASVEEVARWHHAKAGWLSYLREYGKAEEALRSANKALPGTPAILLNLSIACGKQGRYDEAIRYAEEALQLPQTDRTVAPIIVACWEAAAGKGGRAKARIGRISPPDEPDEQRHYFTCMASYHAISGNEMRCEEAIKHALDLDKGGRSKDFFATDVLFDPYRDRPWFAKLAKTWQGSAFEYD